MNELIEIVRQADAAIARGADPIQVSARVSQLTQGRFANIEAAREAAAMQSATAPAAAPVAAPQQDRGRPGLFGTIARQFAQGASMGLSDELSRDLTVDPYDMRTRFVDPATLNAGTERLRERHALDRQTRPIVSGIANIAGAVAVPGIAAALPGTGASLAARMAIGSGVGAAEGAISTVGFSDGRATPESVGLGTLAGAVFGGGAGALGHGIQRYAEGRRAVKASELLRQELERAESVIRETPTPEQLARGLGVTDEISALTDIAKQNKQAVSRAVYGPLEEAYSAIDDPQFTQLVASNPRVAEAAENVIRRTPQTPATGTRAPISFARPSAKTPSEPGYVYHATNIENAQGIAESGRLRPYRPWHGTDQGAWPDGSTASRSYFSKRADVVHSFAPAEGQPVILRVKQNAAPFQAERGTGDVFSSKSVPASAIEILDESGTWRPLSEAFNEGTNPNAPSFTQIQQMRRYLRSKSSASKAKADPFEAQQYRDALAELDGMLERIIPEYAEANRAYATASAAESAFGNGMKAWGKNPDTIRRMLAQLPDDISRENFRIGMAAKLFERWSTKGIQLTRAQLEDLLSLGMRNRLRELFRDPADFDRFIRNIEDFAEGHRSKLRIEQQRAMLAPKVDLHRKWNRYLMHAAATGLGAAGVGGILGMFK